MSDVSVVVREVAYPVVSSMPGSQPYSDVVIVIEYTCASLNVAMSAAYLPHWRCRSAIAFHQPVHHAVRMQRGGECGVRDGDAMLACSELTMAYWICSIQRSNSKGIILVVRQSQQTMPDEHWSTLFMNRKTMKFPDRRRNTSTSSNVAITCH